jgi:hypothetical protein
MNALATGLPGYREEDMTVGRPVPRFFPEELRIKPQPSIHPVVQPWERTPPANPERALQEIAAKVFSDEDRKAIQKLENELGKVDADRKKFCDSKKIDDALWALSQQFELSAEEYAEKTRKLEQDRQAIPQWTLACDRRDAVIKEKLRPYALRLAVELPGYVAKAINEQEKAGGPDGVMGFWGLGQGFDQNVIILSVAPSAHRR